MALSGYNQEIERVPDRTALCDLVRLDEHEGIDDGRDERCDRGSRRDAVRREPGVQGVCERTHLESGKTDLSSMLFDAVLTSEFFVRQCRLEANYAHQQELDMIPLMMQQDYKPQGWRKSQYRVLRLLRRSRDAVDVRDNDD